MAQGFFSVQQACPTCHGRGQMISDPCGSCRGQGVREERKTLSVKIPAGVDTGDRIRLSGKGEAGPHGGPPGDLYVQMVVRKHPIFVRDDSNLHCEVPISFAQAALGGDLEVPTLSGKVKLKIPAETQSGKLFRLRGKGVAPVRRWRCWRLCSVGLCWRHRLISAPSSVSCCRALKIVWMASVNIHRAVPAGSMGLKSSSII